MSFPTFQDEVILTKRGKLKIIFFFFKAIALFKEKVLGVSGELWAYKEQPKIYNYRKTTKLGLARRTSTCF